MFWRVSPNSSNLQRRLNVHIQHYVLHKFCCPSLHEVCWREPAHTVACAGRHFKWHSACILYVIVLVHVGCNGVIVVVVVVDMRSDSIGVLVVVAIVVVGRSTSVVVCLPWLSVFLSPP